MQIQVNHVTSSGVQGGVGDVGVDADGFSYDKELPDFLSLYNYFLLLKSNSL